jgi:hypothetical protein
MIVLSLWLYLFLMKDCFSVEQAIENVAAKL